MENNLKEEEYTISGLYYKYGKLDDTQIKEYLKSIKIVKCFNDKYYPLSDDMISKICKNPRGCSLSFDATDTLLDPIDLHEFKIITYLVKSSSRFFLKPDIGEILDQINFMELNYHIQGICYLPEQYEVLPDTDGEHFIMKAILLQSTSEIRDIKLNKILP